jgi:hypothetical protein
MPYQSVLHLYGEAIKTSFGFFWKAGLLSFETPSSLRMEENHES